MTCCFENESWQCATLIAWKCFLLSHPQNCHWKNSGLWASNAHKQGRALHHRVHPAEPETNQLLIIYCHRAASTCELIHAATPCALLSQLIRAAIGTMCIFKWHIVQTLLRTKLQFWNVMAGVAEFFGGAMLLGNTTAVPTVLLSPEPARWKAVFPRKEELSTTIPCEGQYKAMTEPPRSTWLSSNLWIWCFQSGAKCRMQTVGKFLFFCALRM